jgi:hypothetical protein
MSYTEYLSRKKAAAPVILDVRPNMDASTYIRHQRVVAAANIYAPTKSVVGNINDMRTSVGRDNNAVKAGVQVTLATGQGGDVPDASTFSDYAAGRAAEMDYKSGFPLGRVTMNSTASGSLSGCNTPQLLCTIRSGAITSASYNPTTGIVTFTCTNSYAPGDLVTVTGITGGGANLNTVFNVSNASVITATGDQFTVLVATSLSAVAGRTFTATSATSSGTTRTFNSSGAFVGFATGNLVATFGFTPSDYNIPASGVTPVAITFSSTSLFTMAGTTSTSAPATVIGTIVNTSLSMSGTASSATRRVAADRTYPNNLIATSFPLNPQVVVPRNASNNTKDILSCRERQGEPHTDPLTPMQKGITHFVDDHISLNSGAFRIGTGSFGSTGSTVQSSNSVTGGCPPAIHTISAVKPRATWGPRPSKGAGGLFNPVVPSQDHPRKIGSLVPSDHLKYVERHHGNDSNVNPRRYPKTPFRIPAGTPAHLKINDEHRGI